MAGIEEPMKWGLGFFLVGCAGLGAASTSPHPPAYGGPPPLSTVERGGGLFYAEATRPDESEMFGGAEGATPSASSPAPSSISSSPTPSPNSPGAPPPPSTVEGGGGPRSALGGGERSGSDDRGLSPSASPDAFSSGAVKADPLQIGGTYYQRLDLSYTRGLTEGEIPLSLPLQVDAFLDGRPNDRVRAYILGRLLYDATKDEYGNPTKGGRAPLPTANASTKTALPDNPEVVLDQAWLKFDLNRAVFVTLGKQHVKWGASRIWNPTDQISSSRRDPLQPYDQRLGANMLKLQAPWESTSSNLYAIALLDNPQPVSTLQQAGAAARLETVLLGAELGLSAVTRPLRQPVYGADLSGPLGPFDAYAEAAILTGDDLVNYEFKSKPTLGSDLNSVYALNRLPGHALQASAGLTYTFSYLANRSATLGLEYFYNELGSTDASVYPVLIYLGKYQSFYVGKHYAALYVSAEGFDSGKKTSYSFSTLSNVSDGSYVSRLDFTWLLLDYLTFGLYGSGHYGTSGGEFNFALSTPALRYGSTFIPPVDVPESPWEAGGSLRVGF